MISVKERTDHMEEHNKTMDTTELERLSHELTYRRYMMDHGKVRGLFKDIRIPEYIALYSIAQDSENASIYGDRTYLQELSEKMRGYVRRILYTGNPNTTSEDISHETVWKPWSKIKNSNRIMTFSATCKKAQTKMTNKYINRAKVKRQMRRRLSKWAYKFLKTRILNNRFFA